MQSLDNSSLTPSQIQNLRSSLTDLITTYYLVNNDRVIKDIIRTLESKELNGAKVVKELQQIQSERKTDPLADRIRQVLRNFGIDIDEALEIKGILDRYVDNVTLQTKLKEFLLSSKPIFVTTVATIQKVSVMSEEIRELEEQLKGFNSESKSLRVELHSNEKVIASYQQRIDDHIQSIGNLASKESVVGLTNQVERLEPKLGSSTDKLERLIQGADGSGGLRQQITQLKTDLGDTTNAPLSSQITQVKTELTTKIIELESTLSDRIGDTTDGSLSSQITKVKTDLTSKIIEVRTELSDRITQVETELSDRIGDATDGSLSSQLTKVKTDLTSKIIEVRTELSDRIGQVETELSDRIGDTTKGSLSSQIADVRTELAEKTTSKQFMRNILLTVASSVLLGLLGVWASTSWTIANETEPIKEDIAEINQRLDRLEEILQDLTLEAKPSE